MMNLYIIINSYIHFQTKIGEEVQNLQQVVGEYNKELQLNLAQTVQEIIYKIFKVKFKFCFILMVAILKNIILSKYDNLPYLSQNIFFNNKIIKKL